jgi:hypothetical protein
VTSSVISRVAASGECVFIAISRHSSSLHEQSTFLDKYPFLPTMAPARGLTFRVARRGDAVLSSPRWNKGTAFTSDERKAFGLVGRLPYQVDTLDQQCDRAYQQLQDRESPLRKNSFLQSLKDQNWVLYYSLISRHLRELVEIIYTPTEVSEILRHPDKCFQCC